MIDDAIAIRPMCYLSLSFDHRIIDGATADRFMAKVKPASPTERLGETSVTARHHAVIVSAVRTPMEASTAVSARSLN